jgi:hypothetical protein
MVPTQPSSNNCGWWRDYFIDLPGLKAKLSDASTGTGSSTKSKVYCLKCFESHISAVLVEDRLKVNAVPPLWQAVSAVSDIEAHCKAFFFLLFYWVLSHLINSQYEVWKHLPIHELKAGGNQKKLHFFNIYGIVNLMLWR